MTFACRHHTYDGPLAATINAATYARFISPVYIEFNANGTFTPNTGSAYLWKTGGGSGSDYEIQTSSIVDDGFSADPSAGSWVSLGTTRTFTRTSTAGFQNSVTAVFKIRMAASPNTVLATATITLDCNMI